VTVKDQGRALQTLMDLVREEGEEKFIEDFYRDLEKNLGEK
jgi:hypothetical protein